MRPEPQAVFSGLIGEVAKLVDAEMGAGYAAENPRVVGDALVALAILELARQVDRMGDAINDLENL